MNPTDSVFHSVLGNMLLEIFNGPPGQEAYVVSPGDPGLLRYLDAIDAAAASKPPASGKPPIVAHVDHLYSGLAVMNKWFGGDPNPFAGVDWNASWKRTSVTEEEWRTMRDGLRREADAWRTRVAARTEWDPVSAAAALSTAAHTAYHFGAIRQLIARHAQ
jgi:hypothetical protein